MASNHRLGISDSQGSSGSGDCPLASQAEQQSNRQGQEGLEGAAWSATERLTDSHDARMSPFNPDNR